MRNNIQTFLLLIGIVFNLTKVYVFPHFKIMPSSDLVLDSEILMQQNSEIAFDNLIVPEKQNNNIGHTSIIQSKRVFRVSASSAELETVFNQYGQEYRVSPDVLRVISYCESTHNPSATNHIYGGLFQFSPSTWASTRGQMGLDPNPDLRFDPTEAVKTAAFKISRGGIGAWPTCGQRATQV